MDGEGDPSAAVGSVIAKLDSEVHCWLGSHSGSPQHVVSEEGDAAGVASGVVVVFGVFFMGWEPCGGECWRGVV